MLGNRVICWTVGFIILANAVLVIAASFKDGHINHSETEVKLKAAGIDGELIDSSEMKNKVILILFFDPLQTNQKSIILYARVLQNIFRNKGLAVIGVSLKEKKITSEFHREGKFSFPFIADEDGNICSQFGVSDCCGGTLLIDKQGKTKFYSRILSPAEDLRQLVEKELTGRVTYEFKLLKQPDVFKLNQTVPDLVLLGINSSRPSRFLDFPNTFLVVTFFSSMCGTCKTGQRMKTLLKMRETLPGDVEIFLVFFKPFNMNDITEWEKSVYMPFEKFFTDDFHTDEENYITDSSYKTDPLTIVLDREKKAIYIEEPGEKETLVLSNILKTISGAK